MKLRVFKCNCCGAKRAWGESVDTGDWWESNPALHCDRCFKVRRHEYCGTEQHEWQQFAYELLSADIVPTKMPAPDRITRRIIENKAFSIQ